MTAELGPASMLPRLDWRFLDDPFLGEAVYLGAPEHPLLAALEALGRTAAVNPTATLTASFDTALLTTPTPDAVRRAARLLRPGGRLYAELPRSRRPWHRSEWRRVADSAGFEDIASYWHVPSFESCAHVVPLTDREALHMLARRHQGTTRGVLKAALLHASTSAGATPYLAGDVSLVARRGPLLGSTPSAYGRTRLLVTPRFRTSRHVVRLQDDSGAQPSRLVVKLPRIATDTSGIAHEAAVLNELAERWPAGRGTFPEVRALQLHSGYPALVETQVPGAVLTHRQAARQPEQSLRVVRRWIEGLPVTGSTATDPGWFDRLVEQPLRELVAHSDPRLGLATLARHTVRAAAVLKAAELPLVFEHGDVTCPNILVDGFDRVGLVDWELAEPRGLPGTDMLHFLAFASFAGAGVHDVPRQVLAFGDAFFGPRPWAADAARGHLRRRGVDDRLLEPLLVTAWGRYAAKIAPRLQRLAASVDSDGGDLVSYVAARDRDVAIWRSLVDTVASCTLTTTSELEEHSWVT